MSSDFSSSRVTFNSCLKVSADTVFSRDWFSDVGDTLSGAFSDAWSSVSSKETWNTVATALEGAGQDALAWSKEAWVNSKAGVECLTEAGSNSEAILECRKNLYTASGASALQGVYISCVSRRYRFDAVVC